MASFQQQPNLQSHLNTPVQSLNEQVMNTLNSRTQYYLNTLGQIKSNYDSVTNLNLTDETNRAELEQLTTDAENKIKDITKTDLSLGDNISQAKKILEPISKNQNFHYDQYITNQVSSGLQEAQSQLSKKGSQYYNSLSVQNLHNTLEDLRNARQSDPNNPKWYEKFTQDTLGTTYQPTNPEEKKDWLKGATDMVKSKTIERQVPQTDAYGVKRLVTMKVSAVDPFEMDNFLKQTMPQSVQVESQLKARLLQRQNLQLSKEPGGAKTVIESYTRELNNLKDEKQKFASAKIANLEAQKALYPTSEKDVISQITKQIDNWKEYRDVKVPSDYSHFDASAYIDPNKKQIAIEQINNILNDQQSKGIIQGMGLDSQSLTYTSDVAAATHDALMYNMAKDANANRLKEWEILQKQGLKFTFDASGHITGFGGGSNPSNMPIHVTEEISNPKTVEEHAKEVILQLSGDKALKQQENVKQLFIKGNILADKQDLLSAIDQVEQENPNANMGEVLRRMPDGENKDLISKMLDSAYADQSNITNKEGYGATRSLNEGRAALMHIFTDQPTLDKIVNKLGIDKSQYSLFGEFATNNKLQQAQDEAFFDKYRTAYEGAFSTNGIKIPENYKGTAITQFNEDAYLYSIGPELQQRGFSKKDVEDTKKYMRGDINSQQLAEINPNFAEKKLVPRGKLAPVWEIRPGKLFTSIGTIKDKWDKVQNDLVDRISKVPFRESNSNFATRAIVKTDEGLKQFDPSRMEKIDVFVTGLKEGISNSFVGQVQNADALEAIKIMRDQGYFDKETIDNFDVKRDRVTGAPYVQIYPDEQKLLAKLKSANGIPDIKTGFGGGKEDLVRALPSLKIRVNEEFARQYIQPQLSKTVDILSETKKGINIPLKSINTATKQPNYVSVYDGGVGQDIVPKIKASFNMYTEYEGGVIRLSEQNIDAGPGETLGELQNEHNVPYEAVVADYEKVIKHIDDLDGKAEVIKNIIIKDGVEIPTNGIIYYKNLSLEAQKKIQNLLHPIKK